MGSTAVSAHSIVQVIDRLLTVVIFGISNAASIVIGHTIGAGRIQEAQKEGETLFLLSFGVSVLIAGLFALIGPATLGLYNVTQETRELTQRLMVTYTFLIVFQCIGSVMTKGVLRGGGDTRFLMVADVFFLWAVSIPLGYLSGLVFGLPIFITVIFLRMDDIIKSTWCVSRLNSGKWIHEVTKKNED